VVLMCGVHEACLVRERERERGERGRGEREREVNAVRQLTID
jgi:hypothetical protein